MTPGWLRLTALVASASLAVCGCSSSSMSEPATSAASSPAHAADSDVQTYLAAVNRLCDALLPKVIRVTHGGSVDVPVKKYLVQQPAHARLLADFDRQLAGVPVPPAAKDKAAALAAYVRFADRLDAKRSAAAKRGEAAYAKEIRAEASLESAPAITALHTAGFGQSCEAR
jgi:hypothetical protein